MKATVKFYLAVFLRRFPYFIIVFTLVSAASITVSRLLPAVYVSGATLLVEAPQIPDQLAAPTVQTAALEELQIIQQRLMTRNNLLDIARRFDVTPDIGTMAADEIVDLMFQKTKIYLNAGAGQATLMNIAFESHRGDIAANVVNEYVTIVLTDNAELRAERAGETLEFFQSEVDRLGAELEKQSARILDFKNANADALPDTLNYRMTQQAALQARLDTANRDIATNGEQRRRLLEIFEATGTIGAALSVQLTPEQQKLQTLEDQLRNALALYSPENPKVKMIQAQVDQQRIVVQNQVVVAGSNRPSASSLLDVQIADLDSRIELLEEQATQLTAQLRDLDDSIARTSANAIALESYTRDYQNIQLQYNSAVDRLSQAATGERIELLSKGRRIGVLDAAVAPSEPARPNRLLIAGGGTIFGAMLGLATVFMLELLNNAIRRPADIRRQLGISPIATVPYMRTPMELVWRRAAFATVLMLLIVGLPAGLYAVHTYFMPLDLIYEKVAAKITKLL